MWVINDWILKSIWQGCGDMSKEKVWEPQTVQLCVTDTA